MSQIRIFESGECSVTFTSANSILPFAKEETLIEFENRMARKISRAAACSGFILILNPNSSLIKRTVLLYSGLRIRAIVCLAPNFFANKQQKAIQRFPGSVPCCNSAALSPVRAVISARTFSSTQTSMVSSSTGTPSRTRSAPYSMMESDAAAHIAHINARVDLAQPFGQIPAQFWRAVRHGENYDVSSPSSSK